MDLYIKNCFHANGEIMDINFKCVSDDVPELITLLQQTNIKSEAQSQLNR